MVGSATAIFTETSVFCALPQGGDPPAARLAHAHPGDSRAWPAPSEPGRLNQAGALSGRAPAGLLVDIEHVSKGMRTRGLTISPPRLRAPYRSYQRSSPPRPT